MTPQQAGAILAEFTASDALRRHAVMVSVAMEAYAGRFGGDADTWAAVGLIHDFDYETYPDLADHCVRGAEILRDRGADEAIIRAMLSHNDATGVRRDSDLEKALYAVDELCGFIHACVLVRPSQSIADLTAQSVKKKLKDKRFAAACNREDIRRGAEQLGVDFDEHLAFVIDALRAKKDRWDGPPMLPG